MTCAQSGVENPTKTTDATSEHVGQKLAKFPCLQSIPKRLPQAVFGSSIAMSRAAKVKFKGIAWDSTTSSADQKRGTRS